MQRIVQYGDTQNISVITENVEFRYMDRISVSPYARLNRILVMVHFMDHATHFGVIGDVGPKLKWCLQKSVEM